MPPTSFTLSSEPTTTGTPLIPASQPSSSPTSKNYFCYDNWQDLAYKIERSYGNETFVVCPGATFRPSLEETIKAYAPNISLMCGYDGAISNNCAFDGGKTHLSIPGGKKVTHLFVSGFVFRNASKTSIVAFGGEKAIAIFHDCFWEVSHYIILCLHWKCVCYCLYLDHLFAHHVYFCVLSKLGCYLRIMLVNMVGLLMYTIIRVRVSQCLYFSRTAFSPAMRQFTVQL